MDISSPGGGGSIFVNFCWVCAAGLSEPQPYYSLAILWLVINHNYMLVIFGQIFNFCDPNIVTFYFCE